MKSEPRKEKVFYAYTFVPCKHIRERIDDIEAMLYGYTSEETSTNVALALLPYMNSYETQISPFSCTSSSSVRKLK